MAIKAIDDIIKKNGDNVGKWKQQLIIQHIKAYGIKFDGSQEDINEFIKLPHTDVAFRLVDGVGKLVYCLPCHVKVIWWENKICIVK